MDLHSKGIHIRLEKGMDLDKYLTKFNVALGYFSKNRGLFELASGRYQADRFLGEGSYSTIVQAIHETNNTISTMKLIDLRDNTLQSVLKECIIHCILEKESEKEPHGPYVPRFYEVAFDPTHNIMILRTERIQDILYYRYKAGTAEENDVVIPRTLAHVAYILNFFYKRLRFNHRDCKPDNFLYNYSPETGIFDLKLIDFTLSCLTWNGIQINAGNYFSPTDPCFHPSRDLTQFIYWLSTNTSIQLTPKLASTFRELLTFPLHSRVCRIFAGCSAYGSSFQTWGQSYGFLNNPRIRNKKTYTLAIKQLMMQMLGLRPDGLASILSYRIPMLPHCPPEKVVNPKTRKCVHRDSRRGKELLKKSKQYSTPSKKTLKQRLKCRDLKQV
jgi:serine/threonine protein kinase